MLSYEIFIVAITVFVITLCRLIYPGLCIYANDVTLRKAAETVESFVSVKAFVYCDNG